MQRSIVRLTNETIEAMQEASSIIFRSVSTWYLLTEYEAMINKGNALESTKFVVTKGEF